MTFTLIIMLLIGWLCANYYSGPVATSIEWLCKVALVIIVIKCIWSWYKNFSANAPKRQARREEKQLMRNDSDPKPRFEDFRGHMNPTTDFNNAMRAWEKRKSKCVTYEIPVTDVLAMEDGEKWYWMEVSTRNPKKIRASSGYDDCSPTCHVCGRSYNKWSDRKYLHGKGLCDACGENMIRAKQPGSEYRLPRGLTQFSETLWKYQMIILLDLEDGIISESQKEREMALALGFELQRIARRDSDRAMQLNREEQQAQAQHEIDNVATRLLNR